MLEFPEKTLFNKPIPKAKFYEKLPATSAVKSIFVNDIAGIVWKNKLSPETLNVKAGANVAELEVIEITLKRGSLDVQILKLIDKGIPYPLLFLLEYEESLQAWIGYKEAGALAVKEYFHTDWLPREELALRIIGLNMDEVYENFIRQINPQLSTASTTSVREAIEQDRERAKIQRRIAQLESRLVNEKQFKKQLEISDEIKKLKASLDALEVSNGY